MVWNKILDGYFFRWISFANFLPFEISLAFSNCTVIESASNLSALAQSFGVGVAIKSWFGLLNIFFETNQIVIVENLHA